MGLPLLDVRGRKLMSSIPCQWEDTHSEFTEDQQHTIEAYFRVVRDNLHLRQFIRWAQHEQLMFDSYKVVVVIYLLRAQFQPQVRCRTNLASVYPAFLGRRTCR